MTIDSEQLKPDLDTAMKFYQKQIIEIDKELFPILEKYQFKNKVPSWKWEIFAAVLVGDKCKIITEGRNSKNGRGADLTKHEIKSRLNGDAIEYQYHKNSWRDKLEEESKISHIYISYWPEYRNLDVRLIPGSNLTDFFAIWAPKIKLIYENENERENSDRARFYIPFKIVCERGTTILSVRNTQVISHCLDSSISLQCVSTFNTCDGAENS